MASIYLRSIKSASPVGMTGIGALWHCPGMTSLGARIKRARKAARLTQASLAERLGVSQPQVPKWEADQTVPSLSHLIGIAETLNASVAWLLLGDSQLQERAENATVPPLRVTGALIPMVSLDQAAEKNFDNPQGLVNPVIPVQGEAAVVVLEDDSNEPAHPRGSMWVLSYDRRAKPGDMVLARHGADLVPMLGEYAIRTTDQGQVHIVTPKNDRWPAARSDLEAVEVVAVMVADIRTPR